MLRAGRRHGRHLEAASGRERGTTASRFTSADVKFTVDAINRPDYNPESTDGFDRIASVDTPDPLTAVVHYKEVYAPYDSCSSSAARCRSTCSKGRDIDRAQRLQPQPARHRAVPRRRVEEPANTSCSSACRTTGAATSIPKIKRLLFQFVANTNTRINQLKSGEVHVVALVPWDKYREMAGVPASSVNRRRATPTST